MTEGRASIGYDVPVCVECRREIRRGFPRVSVGGGWRCAECEYGLQRVAATLAAERAARLPAIPPAVDVAPRTR